AGVVDLLAWPGPGRLAAAAGRADVDAQLVRHETCTAVVKRDSGRPGAQAWHDERDRLQGVEGDLLGVDDVDEDLDRIVEARRSTQSAGRTVAPSAQRDDLTRSDGALLLRRGESAGRGARGVDLRARLRPGDHRAVRGGLGVGDGHQLADPVTVDVGG